MGGTLRNLSFKILSMQDIKLALKDSGSQNFSSPSLMVEAVGGAHISVNGGGGDGQLVTDGFFLLFSCYLIFQR
jgi:hypothetical protein